MIASIGRFDDAALEALCVDNVAPSAGDIGRARLDLPRIAEAFADLLYTFPVVADRYVRSQAAFRRVASMMAAEGWTFCGSGYYSATFFRGGLVIKLGFKAEDSALDYARWCRANQGMAGVPVIHRLLCRGFGYAILMDRLEAIAGELELGSPAFDPMLYAEFSSVQDTINNGVDGWGKHMELCRTGLAIREYFEDTVNWDVHPCNVMLDRSGNLVITDPISFVGDTLSDEDDSEGYSGYQAAVACAA